ncbi:MAG: hypothetical protein KC736_03490 [Candidatus Moranbacteria bacterium]|nr:hypothetical protein [Candidatus Moranbacteria bacterium]
MEKLHSKKMLSSSKSSSTERYVDVAEVRDGVIVLNSGALRSVLLVSSINFDLKSTDEQDAIVLQYQNFLNSLDFPIQIVISSRKFNITPYLEMLYNLEKGQRNELLRLQTSEYRTFIKNLTDRTNLMSKFFYVVVPFSPVEDKNRGILPNLGSLFNPRRTVLAKREVFETYKNQLWQRVDHVRSALSSTGVKAAALNTEELIELLYNSYNPTLFTNTIVRDISDIDLADLPQ